MSSSQARGRSPPPVHKSVVVQYLKDGHSSSLRPPLYSPYPSTGHSSVGRVVRPYETPPLLAMLRLVRAFPLSISRACHKVHVEDGTHRVDISPTSGSMTLQHTPLSAHCSGPGAALGVAPSYSRASIRSRWSSRMLRTDVRLLQAVPSGSHSCGMKRMRRISPRSRFLGTYA